jgi:predicted CoA-substrate-specific enzyme activase
MTIQAGIDIGSRTIKVVLINGDRIVRSNVADTTYDPLAVCRYLLADLDHRRITVTGYGRHLFARQWDSDFVSEIKAVGLGAGFLLPGCRTVLDIGGQDTKAISLDETGKLKKFMMNDRCAAGTGRFLEVMAGALSYNCREFDEAALSASRAAKLNSMCTVFAESEVISLVAQGAARESIALGIHQSIAARTLSLLKGIPLVDPIVFAGGGALNACLRREIESGLGMKLHPPAQPQIVAALGAAIYGSQKENKNGC